MPILRAAFANRCTVAFACSFHPRFGVKTWPRYFVGSRSRIIGRVTRSFNVLCGTDTLVGDFGPPFFGMYMCLHLGALSSIP
jgi:hypothetical protein